MTYFVMDDVKALLGETTDRNNNKIANYGNMADLFINQSLVNIEPVLPLPVPIPKIVSDFATILTVNMFYKYESGEEEMVEQLKAEFKEVYIRNKYNRPNFRTRTW